MTSDKAIATAAERLELKQSGEEEELRQSERHSLDELTLFCLLQKTWFAISSLLSRGTLATASPTV